MYYELRSAIERALLIGGAWLSWPLGVGPTSRRHVKRVAVMIRGVVIIDCRSVVSPVFIVDAETIGSTSVESVDVVCRKHADVTNLT